MTLPATLPGLHRATVQDLNDPDAEGRVGVILDAYLNEPILWAVPCVPYAGPGVGLRLVPQIGDKVWIAFENEQSANPVWVGCFWATPPPEDPEIKFLRTRYGRITIDDTVGQGKLAIETEDGTRLEMKEAPTPPALMLEELGGARIEMNGGEVKLEGWPMRFAPPSDAVLQRLDALEAAVAELQGAAPPDPAE